jgi:hypothetical protein
MERRVFLRLSGMLGAAYSLSPWEMAVFRVPDEPLQAPGTYQIRGRVRLDAPLGEISGITNAQQSTWAGLAGTRQPVAGFTSFETFAQPWRMSDLSVRGGRLDALSIVPVELG